MNVNLEYLKIDHERESEGLILFTFQASHTDIPYVGHKGVITTIKETVYLHLPEVEFIRTCIAGSAPFYPFISDGYHRVRFTPNGFIYNKEGQKDFMVSFPFHFLSASYPFFVSEVELSSTDCEELMHQFLPLPEVIIDSALQSQLEKWNQDNNPDYDGLHKCLNGVIRIANNYSHGVMGNCTVNFYLDSNPNRLAPPDVYFSVMTHDGNRVINGGIIYHANRDENNDPVKNESGVIIGKYSSHT